MSLKARRLSKWEDDRKLLAEPKIRDRSRKPKILVRRGAGVTEHEPIVGETIWGVLECIVETTNKYGSENIKLLSGADWESIPCLVTEVRDQEAMIVFSIASTDTEAKTMIGKVPRVDQYVDEPEKADQINVVHPAAPRSRLHRRSRKAPGAGR